MSKHQESKKIRTKDELLTKNLQDHLLENNAEINDLVNSSDFIEFVQTISETIDDNTTFNELLSSRVILQKALAVLKKIQEDSQKL
jgi:hypothetical protein